MPTCLIRDFPLHFIDEGTGPAVVLLHGLGNSGRDWEFHSPDLLAEGYRVVRPDFFGFGRSARPPDGYGPAAMASDVRALLEFLQLERAHLVGYSMGGAVAYQMAVDEPQRWSSLAIISSVPCFVPQRLYDHWQFWLRHVLSRVLGMQHMAQRVTENLFGHLPELAAKMLPRYADNDVEVYRKVLAALSGWDIRSQLSQIACPVLIIAAQSDYFRLEDIESGMQGLPASKLLIVPDTRHGLPMEKPEAVTQALLRFFSRSSKL